MKGKITKTKKQKNNTEPDLKMERYSMTSAGPGSNNFSHPFIQFDPRKNLPTGPAV